MWVICNFYFFLVSFKGHIHRIRVRSCHINSQSTLTVFAYFLMQPICYIIKSRGLRPATFFWKRPEQTFRVNFVKSLRIPFLQNNSVQLLLDYNIKWNNFTSSTEKSYPLFNIFHKSVLFYYWGYAIQR